MQNTNQSSKPDEAHIWKKRARERERDERKKGGEKKQIPPPPDRTLKCSCFDKVKNHSHRRYTGCSVALAVPYLPRKCGRFTCAD